MTRGIISVTMTVLALLALLMAVTSAASLGDATDSTDVPPKPVCKGPCGWAVYTPIERKIDYYVKNRGCQCAPEKKCLRRTDDISVSAYVYECMVPESS